jgi:hypothetical protein
MLTPQVDTGSPELGKDGLGVFLYGTGSSARFGHDGADERFQAILIGFYSGKGLVVMSNSPTAKFCIECAKPLESAGGKSQGTIAPSSPVQADAGSTEASLEGERKTVTALFADIKGSAQMEQDLDPRRRARLLQSTSFQRLRIPLNMHSAISVSNDTRMIDFPHGCDSTTFTISSQCSGDKILPYTSQHAETVSSAGRTHPRLSWS